MNNVYKWLRRNMKKKFLNENLLFIIYRLMNNVYKWLWKSKKKKKKE